MHRYGEFPVSLGVHQVNCEEMMFYQYLPIKLIGGTEIIAERRVTIFSNLIGTCCCDFIGEFGLDRFIDSYVYLTAKRMYQMPGCSYNREGWHADGFMTDDINYIWADNNPTVFNDSQFNLTQDHHISMLEMDAQANYLNNGSFTDCELLRLNQYNIHKVSEILEPCMRTFFKLSISTDQYNLKGNSINQLLDYSWEMKDRAIERNHPSK